MSHSTWLWETWVKQSRVEHGRAPFGHAEYACKSQTVSSKCLLCNYVIFGHLASKTTARKGNPIVQLFLLNSNLNSQPDALVLPPSSQSPLSPFFSLPSCRILGSKSYEGIHASWHFRGSTDGPSLPLAPLLLPILVGLLPTLFMKHSIT